MKWIACIALAACGPKSPPASDPAPARGESSRPDPWGRPAEGPRERPAEGPPERRAPEPVAEAPPEKPKQVGGVAQQYLDAHNKHRAKHCAPPLTWSPKLADLAQKWANHLRDHCGTLEHSSGTKYGENLAAGSIGALDPTSTVDYWYDEIKKYKFPNGGFSMTTGHLTQLLWRSTRQVGCAQATCKGLEVFVCEYDPPGNVDGEYRTEVLPSSCKK